MLRPDLWFDVYPYDNPQAGARLARLTKDQLLAGSRFRVERRGPGSGLIVLNSGQAEFTAANLHEENLVEVGDANVSATEPLGGFMLQRGDFQIISSDEQGGENFPIGGPGLLSYTAREVLWNHTYITSGGAMDPFGDLWRFGNQGLWAGGSRLGAFAHRACTECLLFRSGAYTHRHGDGLTYTDTHPEDRVGSSHIGLLTLDFTELLDSDGNAFPLYDGEFSGRVKQTLYSVLLELIGKGLDLQMRGGRQLLLSAYNSYGRDLRGAAFGPGVVRFVHGVNIANPARRAIESSQRASRALVGRDDEYSLVNSPVAFHVGRSIGVDSEAESATGQASDGDAELRRRKDGSDVPALKAAYGDDEANGLYLFAPPEVGGHAWVGDLTKVHRGTGAFQWNNEDARIEAIQFDLTEERVWDDPTIEFGAVYRTADERGRLAELQSIANKPHGPHIRLCDPALDCHALTAGQMTVGTATNGDVESGATNWSGGSVTTAMFHAGTNGYGVTSVTSADLIYDFGSQAFEQGTRYVFDIWLRLSDDHLTTTITAGDEGGDEESETYAGTPGTDPPGLFDEEDTGADGQPWFRARVCWTPSADRTNVRVRAQITANQSGTDIAVDDLALYTAPTGLAGTSPKASRCDHNHLHNALEGRNSLDAHTASAIAAVDTGGYFTSGHVEGQLQEIGADLAGGIVSDHGALTGLADNDHPQYWIHAGGGEVPIEVVMAAGAAETVDISVRPAWDMTLDSATCAIDFDGFTNGVRCYGHLHVRQDATGGRLATWDAAVQWIGGVAPILQTAADAWDDIFFYSDDGGTTVIAQHAGTSSGSGSDSGHILIESEPAGSPLVFADLMQNSEGTDLLYASEG